MNKTISRLLTSKREKCHALLERKKNKDDVIPWSNYITHIGNIHPLIHGYLHVTILINIIKKKYLSMNMNQIPWIIHQQVATTLTTHIYLCQQAGLYTHQIIVQVLFANGCESKTMNLHSYLIRQQLHDIHNYHQLWHRQYFKWNPECMDEIDPTLASSSLVLFVQMMMHTVSVWISYFAPNVMHSHTLNKKNHASLIFLVRSYVSFEHL